MCSDLQLLQQYIIAQATRRDVQVVAPHRGFAASAQLASGAVACRFMAALVVGLRCSPRLCL